MVRFGIFKKGNTVKVVSQLKSKTLYAVVQFSAATKIENGPDKYEDISVSENGPKMNTKNLR